MSIMSVDDSLSDLDWMQYLVAIKTTTEINSDVASYYSADKVAACMDYRTNHKIKPPFSFSKLIYMALRESGDYRLTLDAIYSWIMNNFPYYSQTHINWKVAIV